MSADKYGKGVKKADNDLVARRVDKVIELISLCKPTGEIVRYCTAEWGVKDRQAEKYLEKARAKIRERFDQMDRKDWVASALEKLEKVAAMSIESRQHSNAIVALGLSAKLLQITGRDN